MGAQNVFVDIIYIKRLDNLNYAILYATNLPIIYIPISLNPLDNQDFSTSQGTKIKHDQK